MKRDSHFKDVDSMIKALKPGYPVYCLRPDELKKNAKMFLDNFPGRVMYAVKCNPHLSVLKAFYEAGIRHFDTASLAEIATIRENFHDADCYFMHPVKARSAILSADKVYRVDHYVIDHEAELKKIVDVTGGGNGQVVIVRLATPQYDAAFALSEKFGATPDEAVELLKKVVAEGCQTGLAFHVGSQCRDKQAYATAMEVVKDVIERAGVNLHYLDCGGGFPAHYVEDQPEPLMSYFQTIKEEVSKLPLRGDCTLMCEPGRALVASGVSLVVQVHLRKENSIYINDGVYHSLSETMTANVKMPMRVVRLDGTVSDKKAPFKIFGPTCDCTDVLPYEVMLPDDVQEGDWIEIGQCGAYSNSMSTKFNGFFPETYVTVDAPPLTPDALDSDMSTSVKGKKKKIAATPAEGEDEKHAA
ncbi:type III PLP-dependent enzyme [Aestuariispira ectoiniformans]|uniref:type III PLP-dependent enzyme n=1 Tax=Aestuariispira ectoiniformans TaxID=2775080 RepID=UPI00223B0D22|nr:type III PLP-dependent enzyme [Aestuariispira ectoiniformans]